MIRKADTNLPGEEMYRLFLSFSNEEKQKNIDDLYIG